MGICHTLHVSVFRISIPNSAREIVKGFFLLLCRYVCVRLGCRKVAVWFCKGWEKQTIEEISKTT